MSDTPSCAIDFDGMCRMCLKAINAAHGNKAWTFCYACRRELRQADDAART